MVVVILTHFPLKFCCYQVAKIQISLGSGPLQTWEESKPAAGGRLKILWGCAHLVAFPPCSGRRTVLSQACKGLLKGRQKVRASCAIYHCVKANQEKHQEKQFKELPEKQDSEGSNPLEVKVFGLLVTKAREVYQRPFSNKLLIEQALTF